MPSRTASAPPRPASRGRAAARPTGAADALPTAVHDHALSEALERSWVAGPAPASAASAPTGNSVPRAKARGAAPERAAAGTAGASKAARPKAQPSRPAARSAGAPVDADSLDGPGSDQVFTAAAELFGLLSTPIRLKILSALCHGERNVSQLLTEIATTQPNMSQHLSTLYRAGVLSRRRDTTQVYYAIANPRAATLCRAVCVQIALDADGIPSG